MAIQDPPEIDWRRNRRLIRDGFKDLEYLPRSRAGWNATLAAHAYSARRQVEDPADLNRWAAMHGCPPSARYEELGGQALVLWHGTSAQRADKIREVGLFHKRGLWTALEPKIAHGYTRGRSSAYGSGSATVVILLDAREVEQDVHYERSGEVLRFFAGMPAECVEYILWDDRIEFLGEQKAREPKPWGVAHFKKREGQWGPRSKPPVRFDAEHTYRDKEEWLALSIKRILHALPFASAIEIFSSLYSTIDPWDALEHQDILEALERTCAPPRQKRGTKRFVLRNDDAEPGNYGG